MEKTLFVLPDHGKTDTPFCQLDFYKWLTDNRSGIERIDGEHLYATIQKAYFKSLGFDKEIHTLGSTWSDDMKLLDYCIDYHNNPY